MPVICDGLAGDDSPAARGRRRRPDRVHGRREKLGRAGGGKASRGGVRRPGRPHRVRRGPQRPRDLRVARRRGVSGLGEGSDPASRFRSRAGVGRGGRGFLRRRQQGSPQGIRPRRLPGRVPGDRDRTVVAGHVPASSPRRRPGSEGEGIDGPAPSRLREIRLRRAHGRPDRGPGRRPPGRPARDQERKTEMTPETLTVSLGDRSYDIHFGKDLREVFGAWLSGRAAGADVFVVTDRNVAAIYGQDIVRWPGEAKHAVLAIEPGEERKTWETVREIYAFLARGVEGGSGRGADRDSIVVAFGGGVVGDLAGFAAATYLRGIRYVQVPTTLLAQVDSSVGGKTGFNLPEGKNLAGAFHQPRAVFIDRSFLLTLDDRNLRAGMAEAVKCALAGDAALWTLLLDHGARWKTMTDRDWGTVVRRSVAFKASVVEKDEKEVSTRRILNLGHTVGHALERAAGYGRFLHGEAVAMGLAWEAVFTSRLGVTPPELADRICALLGEMGFVLDDAGVPTPSIAAALSADKKRVEADIELPMVTAPGACSLRRVPAARLGADLAEVRDEVRERGRMPGLAPAASLSERAEAAGRGMAVPAEERVLLERIARGEGKTIVAALERKVATDPRDV